MQNISHYVCLVSVFLSDIMFALMHFCFDCVVSEENNDFEDDFEQEIRKMVAAATEGSDSEVVQAQSCKSLVLLTCSLEF